MFDQWINTLAPIAQPDGEEIIDKARKYTGVEAEWSSQTTMFSRLEWSPDGQFLFAPCAMNNQGPTAQIIMRKDWDTELDLVGHRRNW
ncbi:hypothetical protein ANCCEY_14498 [Ancylostoma ceylanicum]|uniref:Uncharacterized protein n=1 Tax=Ancylostoma ceylanicum TaxID=53326 RepID=A0A0D6L6G8_9BILA|nr:hypothetical protein ANCCEY_14498 [Ancylostoma ceylanicum]